MSREDGKAAAAMLEATKEGWEKWPSMKALPNDFGVRIWGKYISPTGHVFDEFLRFLVGCGLLYLAFQSWQTALVFTVLVGVSWNSVMLSLIGSSFTVEITRDVFRVNRKKYQKALYHEIRCDDHEKAIEEAQQEYDSQKRGSTNYRRSKQVIFQSLEKRIVIASIFNDLKKAEQLTTRLNILNQILKHPEV